MKNKQAGIDAAVWFYSQPGFHSGGAVSAITSVQPEVAWQWNPETVYEMRPLPKEFLQCWRYAGGKWIPDDGEWDLAFAGRAARGYPLVSYVKPHYQRNVVWAWCKDGNWGGYEPKHPRGNAWHYMLRDGEKKWGGDWGRERHENARVGSAGMNWLSSREGCANGRGPEWRSGDEHIEAGLVRERDSKLIVAPPPLLVCMYGCPPEASRVA